MKRHDKEYEKLCGPVRLYLEDIEYIAEMLSVDGRKLEIETSEWNLESASEIPSLKEETLNQMTFQSRASDYGAGSITLRLQPSLCSLTSTSSDPISWGICGKLNDFLDTKRHPFVPRNSFFWLGGIGLLYLLISMAFHFDAFYSLVISNAIMWPAQFYLVWFSFRGQCVIYLKNRKDAPGFWKKNRADFAKTIVSGLIGFGFGLLGNWFKGVPPAAPSGAVAGTPAQQAGPTSMPSQGHP
jgi:hypothetical protein